MLAGTPHSVGQGSGGRLWVPSTTTAPSKAALLADSCTPPPLHQGMRLGTYRSLRRASRASPLPLNQGLPSQQLSTPESGGSHRIARAVDGSSHPR